MRNTNVLAIFAALILWTCGAGAVEECGIPCKMPCYEQNPEEVRTALALSTSPILAAIIPQDFDVVEGISLAKSTFPVSGGFFKGSELKTTAITEGTDGVVKVLSACGLMAVHPEKEYIAFKIGVGLLPFPTAVGPQGKEVCAAFQVCDQTITLGMRGFSVKIKTPFGDAVVGPTAFGVSATGGLYEKSKGPMWFGGSIATETKVVTGHLQMAGFMQYSVGWPGILTFNLRADAFIIMNLADSAGEVVVPDFEGIVNSLDEIEVLISAAAAPNIEVFNLVRIDLSKFLGSAQASVYLSTLGGGNSFQLGVAFAANLKPIPLLAAVGLNSGLTTDVIGQLVKNLEVSANLQAYVGYNDTTDRVDWGLRMEGTLEIFKSALTKDISDVIVSGLSIEGGTNSRTTISLWNANDDRVLKVSLCSAESHCKDDEYCDKTFGSCTKRVGRGTPCLVDKVCKKAFTCVRGFCNRECKVGCRDYEYCDDTFAVCAPKVGLGTPCLVDKVCKDDLVCKLGSCQKGCENDAACGDGKFCNRITRQCNNQYGRGRACTGSFQCKSQFTCVRGFCNKKCSKGCSGNEYCDSAFEVCALKVGQGSVCVEDKVCKDDLLCKLGTCQKGCESDDACGSGKFCNRVTRDCDDEYGRGAVCTGSFQCQSRYTCVRGFCNRECSKGCNSDEYCDSTFNVCASKVGRDSVCVEDKVCKDGLVCKLGSCQKGCKNDAACGTGRYCDRTFRTCEDRVGRGKVCLESFTCQERYKCYVGFCNRKCNSGCSSSEFCDAFKNCVGKFGRRHACLSGKECKSGRCRWFRCT